MGYAGQSGGPALANVVFGQYNSGGRLPITFYPASYVDAVSMFDMQMRPSPTNRGRTYKFYTGQPIFEFVYDLSYTTFSYTWSNDSTVSIQSLMKIKSNQYKVHLHLYRVNVTNTGSVLGDDVVLAYVTPPSISLHDPSPPIKRLFGFEGVHLDVGQTAQVFFPLNSDSLLTVGHDGSKWLEPDAYRIVIGKQHMHTVHLRGKAARWA